MKKRLLITSILTAALGLGIFSCSSDHTYVSTISIQTDALKDEGKYRIIPMNDTMHLQLKVKIMPDNANKNVIISNNNPEILNVTKDGFITALKVGRDTINIESTDGSGMKVQYGVLVSSWITKATAVVVSGDAASRKMEVGTEYNLAEKVTVQPATTTDKSVSYTSSDESIVTASPTGILKAIAEGKATITVKTLDGSEKETQSYITVVARITGPIPYDRKGWTSTQSHDRPVDAGITNAADSHLDGNETTCLSLVKPGKTYEGVTVPANERSWFIVDMLKKQTIEYFSMDFRKSGNTSINLRPWGVTISGSNDGTNFTVIKADIDLPNAQVADVMATGAIEIPKSEYQYLKVEYTKWNEAATSTCQISEFNAGYIIK